ncbi:MAG TPA: TlpA disulfide reductase family protein [Bryobacteraceae bacterium]|jgi:peroxiredoxin|nr:TlpA disulfide reductase family protein [Bryobacteraceae bacterium]
MRASKLDKGLLAGVFVMFGLMAWMIVSTLHETVVHAGDKAPDFSIATDQGRRITPTDFGGRILVLNFWASWCAPCVEELPSLSEFQKQTAGSGVVVVGVSIDRNQKLYNDFVRRFHPSFQTARDPNADISSSYGTFKVPETYIIDRTGRVVQKVIGAKNWMDPDALAAVKAL